MTVKEMWNKEVKRAGEGRVKMSSKEWSEKGVKLFGEDKFKWKFVCPNCGNIQSAEDLRKYKEQGAKPYHAYYNCIGRYQENCKGTFGNGESPCDYTSGGFFNISPVIVVNEGGKEISAFAFAENGGVDNGR